MYGLVVAVKFPTGGPTPEAKQMLESAILPMVKGWPGFVRGTWLQSIDGTNGTSLMLFDSKESAEQAAKNVREMPPPPGAPTPDWIQVYEVVAEA